MREMVSEGDDHGDCRADNDCRGEDDLGMTSQRSGEKKIEEEADGQQESNLMGAMAAAMSGTAMLASFGADHAGGKNEELFPLDAEKTGTSTVEKSNLITTFAPLAEKAMSVAAPVVPQTEDGEIDHERSSCLSCKLLCIVFLVQDSTFPVCCPLVCSRIYVLGFRANSHRL
jgi:hypothetical protein